MARTLAAVAVLLGHVRNDYFVAYGDLLPEFQNPFNFAAFLLTRLGHEAVMVFFVLSGFLVGGNALQSWCNQTFRFSEYFGKRATRMYVVLIPSLFIGGAVDLLLEKFGGGLHPNFTVQAFWGNLFFLQTIAGPTFGSNPPLWSLAYEFWYYLLWPAVLLLVSGRNWQRIFALLVLLPPICVAPHIMKLFPLWIFGAMLRAVPQVRMRKFLFPVILGLFGLAALYGSWGKNVYGEYATGIMFGLIILCWINITSCAGGADFWRATAAFSFSLYAIHYPLMKILILLLNQYADLGARNATTGACDWLWVLVISAILIGFGWLFYFCFERNTDWVREKLAYCGKVYARRRNTVDVGQ